jgi:hypothetical protein
MLPKHWPKRLLYARECVSSEIHMTLLRSYLYTGNPEDIYKCSWVIENTCVHPHLEIKKLLSPHPLSHQKTKQGYANYGVFATQPIEPGVELGEYVGELILKSRQDLVQSQHLNITYSEYSWSILLDHLLLTIDCHRIGNELAFINDYRGLCPKPNVHMQPIIHKGMKYYGYVTICCIKQGEEILVDYLPHGSAKDLLKN